ncbi:MAG: AMP-binding protein [Acidimicrobiales bacterium]
MTVTTLAGLLDQQASQPLGDAPRYSFVEEAETWSCAGLARRATRVAGQLRRGGVGHGDHVGLLCDDRQSFVEAFFGLQHRGAVPVPVGVAGRPGGAAWTEMLARRCASLRLAALVTDPPLVDACRAAAPGVSVLTVDGTQGPPDPPGDPCPVAFIQPSSGTTGEPRGVVLSHRAVLANLTATREAFGLGPWFVCFTWLPFFHDMGLVGTVLNPLFSEFLVHIWRPKLFVLRPRRWLELVSETGSTLTVAPPFALEMVTRAVRRTGGGTKLDLSGVDAFLVGSEQIRPRILDDFAETFAPFGLRPEVITPVYGLAEAVLTVAVTRIGDGATQTTVRGRRAVACGSAVPGTQLSLSPDDELLVRTPSAMDGYLGDEPGTARVLADGWLHTGDVAELTTEGLVVVGRAKEMLNRNGIRIPPEDLESVAASVDGVRAGRVVAVADTSDARERIVVLAESAAQGRDRDHLVLAIRAELADAGTPADVVDLVPRGFLPRTTSGKLRRTVLLDAYRQRTATRQVGTSVAGPGR